MKTLLILMFAGLVALVVMEWPQRQVALRQLEIMDRAEAIKDVQERAMMLALWRGRARYWMPSGEDPAPEAPATKFAAPVLGCGRVQAITTCAADGTEVASNAAASRCGKIGGTGLRPRRRGSAPCLTMKNLMTGQNVSIPGLRECKKDQGSAMRLWSACADAALRAEIKRVGKMTVEERMNAALSLGRRFPVIQKTTKCK
jgi:hypothetical protein